MFSATVGAAGTTRKSLVQLIFFVKVGEVFISNFKFAHTAISSMPQEKEKKTEQTKLFVNAMSSDNQDRSAADDKDPNGSIAKTLPLYDRMNALIYVKRGKIEISVAGQ